jgi:hypothetical protein
MPANSNGLEAFCLKHPVFRALGGRPAAIHDFGFNSRRSPHRRRLQCRAGMPARSPEPCQAAKFLTFRLRPADLMWKACRDGVIRRCRHESFACKPARWLFAKGSKYEQKILRPAGNGVVLSLGRLFDVPGSVRLLCGDDWSGRSADGRIHDASGLGARRYAGRADVSIAADSCIAAGSAGTARRSRGNISQCRRTGWTRRHAVRAAALLSRAGCRRKTQVNWHLRKRVDRCGRDSALLPGLERGTRQIAFYEEIGPEFRWYFDLYLFRTSRHNTASIGLPKASQSRHISRCLSSARRSRKTR